MKLFIFVIVALFMSVTSFARDVHVNGYTKSNGTYVAPHERSAPDSTRDNNWSTKGNVNPYTGKEGTKDPYGTTNGSDYNY